MPSYQSSRVTPGQFLFSGLAIIALAVATPGFAQIPPRPNGTQQVSMRPASPLTPATLPIKSSMLLCGIVDCGPAQVISQPTPIITQVSPASVIEPGGNVLVHGTDFNARNGTYGGVVLIVGDPRALSHREFVLQNTQWSNKAAFGQIPPDISGLIDQVAWLQVRRSDGVNSDPAKVVFTARRILSCIHTGDFQAQCSTTADQNQCNAWGDYSPLLPPLLYDNASFYGVHNTFYGDSAGTDQFAFKLKNGWVFDHLDVVLAPVGGSTKCGVVNASIPEAGSNQGTISVSWVSDCRLHYERRAAINGPIGVGWN